MVTPYASPGESERSNPTIPAEGIHQVKVLFVADVWNSLLFWSMIFLPHNKQ